ncbi:DNA repair protein NreA [Halomarina litorea]|uniref:DNA repair protein NreA n=1 Tax=Halomarina litorea TaxID=2961595 RepID=UPI0020C25781|nr:DNA repair protein NreA [Halomarina sp. BCD28]
MRLDEYIEGFEVDEAAERRRLAEEKSYEVLDYLDDVDAKLDPIRDTTHVGRSAPSIFVGRSSYPNVSTGILAPVDADADPAEFATSGQWYDGGLGIRDVLQYRTGLLNSTRRADVNVHDTWDGFVGTQREVAIADRPVAVEVDLGERPSMDVGMDAVSTPTGPRANATDARLTENPHVPRAVEKTLSDDDWRAEGAMTYLYNRGFDVYDINRILSAGALGQGQNRRLVPTRWSITAVDDTVGQFLRGQVRNAPSVDEVEVYEESYMGNHYWIVLAPGNWEFELVEMKSPGSIWNPDEGAYRLLAANEGYEGRTGYVEETSGAYYATRLAVLEHLAERDRQAKAFVVRVATDEYWAPVGVWQIRESVRGALGGERAVAETFHGAVRQLAPLFPVPFERLRRKSHLVSGVQSTLDGFGR